MESGGAMRRARVATALLRLLSGSGQPSAQAAARALFQAWREANFSIHLAPQWVKSGISWIPAPPAIYRQMLNSFYAGIKSVRSDNVVITTGFGPYGDSAGPCSTNEIGPGCRMPPAMFARELMCLHGRGLTPESCPDPPSFDALVLLQRRPEAVVRSVPLPTRGRLRRPRCQGVGHLPALR